MPRGRETKWPGEDVVTFYFKGPKSLEDKIIDKIKQLKARGIKANKSDIQRVLVENGVEDVERFFKQELITR